MMLPTQQLWYPINQFSSSTNYYFTSLSFSVYNSKQEQRHGEQQRVHSLTTMA